MVATTQGVWRTPQRKNRCGYFRCAAILFMAAWNFWERERPARFFGKNKGNASGTLALPAVIGLYEDFHDTAQNFDC
jgi:hypothetical protein